MKKDKYKNKHPAKSILAFRWISLALSAGVMGIGLVYYSYYEFLLGTCAVFFALLQFGVAAIKKSEKEAQNPKVKPLALLSLLPSLGIVAAGILLLFLPSANLPPVVAYIIVAGVSALTICGVLQLFDLGKSRELSARFSRSILVSGICAVAPLFVTTLLWITKAEGGAELGALSTIAFGSAVVLIAANLILVSFCGHKSTAESIKTVSKLIKSKKYLFARASLIKDTFIVVGKSVLTVLSLSFFMLANTLYSAGMGVARFVAIRMVRQDRKKQIVSYRCVGIIIFAASIFYTLYSARLFFGGKSNIYSMNMALAIALYTFVEFGINVREAFRLRKSDALEAKAMRAISFASTLLCFALTQTAIMSFANAGDNSATDALAGVVFGSLAALAGLFVLVDSFFQKKARIAELEK